MVYDITDLPQRFQVIVYRIQLYFSIVLQIPHRCGTTTHALFCNNETSCVHPLENLVLCFISCASRSYLRKFRLEIFNKYNRTFIRVVYHCSPSRIFYRNTCPDCSKICHFSRSDELREEKSRIEKIKTFTISSQMVDIQKYNKVHSKLLHR